MPTKPSLLPNVLDFGLVRKGENPGGMAGIGNWPTAQQVTAKLTDNSGGLFTKFSLGIYNVQIDDSGDLPHPGKIRPPRWVLVEMAAGDGSLPLQVFPGQTVGVGLFFSAPNQATADAFTGTIQIISLGSVVATIPVTASVGAPDVSENWTLANPFGIQLRSLPFGIDPLIGDWNSGNVQDALVLSGNNSGALLVGTDRAGVWIVDRPGAICRPLTNDWQSNNVLCLCQGSRAPENIYVGTWQVDGTLGTIIETEDLGTWRDISPQGQGIGTVYKIVVTSGPPRRIVMATDSGVFWSPLPPVYSANYSWQQAQGLPRGAYAGLALGRSDRIAVAALGVDRPSRHYGIFYGDWASGNLVLTQSIMSKAPPLFAEGMGTTSLASCAGQPRYMYAVSSALDTNAIYTVLFSQDSGASWNVVKGRDSLVSQAGSFQTAVYHCIAVPPTDEKRVLIGWQNGTFQSGNHGDDNFTVFNDPNLHKDVHAVYFDPADPASDTFYICSDGGVAKTKNGGQAFDGSFNTYLANLEFSGISVRGDLVSCAAQDNGILYCWLRSGNDGNVSPWLQAAGGDGVAVCLIASGRLIASVYNADGRPGPACLFQRQPDDPARLTGGAKPIIPVRDQNVDDEGGLEIPTQQLIAPVNTPTYGCAGQKMYAVAGGSKMSDAGAIQTGPPTVPVHGLFANDDGSNVRWENIGNITSDIVGDYITAVAVSDDGTSVFVGTNAGRFFLLQPSCAAPMSGQEMIVNPISGNVSRIVFASAKSAIAISGSSIMFNGTLWRRVVGSGLPGGPYNGLARDGYDRIWTCTDDKVFVSRDDGLTWKDAYSGLPVNVHCRDLSCDSAQQNPPLLYLATWGHSVWVTGVLE